MTSTAEAEAVAELVDVRRVYRMGTTEVPALDGVSHAFRAGALVDHGQLRRSGKSTLLNILGCIDRPTAGEYRVGGRGVSSLSDDELSGAAARAWASCSRATTSSRS